MDLQRVLWQVAEKAFAAYSDWEARCGLILYFSKPDAPAAPDYKGAAQATSTGSVQAAIANALLNRANQSTPYGSQTWQQTGTAQVPAVGTNPAVDVPQFSSNINLTPQGQQLLDADTRQKLGLAGLADTSMGQVGSSLSSPLNLGGALPDYNQKVADALYQRSTRYLDPQWAQAETDERSRLANSGFSQQNEGYGKAIDRFGAAKEAAYGTARDQAVAAGGDVGLRQRQQSITEALMQRQQPLTELNALRTGAQPNIPSFPSTNVGANAVGPNLLGAAGQQSQYAGDIYNAQTGTYNSNIGALGNLGAMALLMSDRRLKRSLTRLVEDPRGFGVYRFKYLWSDDFQVGVMADEVQRVLPEAVLERLDGYLMVDYGALYGSN